MIYIFLKRLGFLGISRFSNEYNSLSSSLSTLLGSGNYPVYSYLASHSAPSNINKVISPPSSTIKFGPDSSPQSIALIVKFQYSSKVSPFHANTFADFALAIAAAA